MVRNKKTVKFLIAMLLPVIILISMTILPAATILFGKEILLETEPYDPRDIFRGDYVTLKYKINDLSLDKFPQEVKEAETPDKYRNKKMYAVLKKENDFYDVDYITLKKPKDKLFLNCRVRYFYIAPSMEPDLKDRNMERKNDILKAEPQTVYVEYNLDKYFVPENTGKYLEELSRQGKLVAKIKVFHGYSLLREVLDQDKQDSLLQGEF